jgi:hypothetical protein
VKRGLMRGCPSVLGMGTARTAALLSAAAA